MKSLFWIMCNLRLSTLLESPVMRPKHKFCCSQTAGRSMFSVFHHLFSNIAPSAISILRPPATPGCTPSSSNPLLVKPLKARVTAAPQLFYSLLLPSMEPPSRGCSFPIFSPKLQASSALPSIVIPISDLCYLLPPTTFPNTTICFQFVPSFLYFLVCSFP